MYIDVQRLLEHLEEINGRYIKSKQKKNKAIINFGKSVEQENVAHSVSSSICIIIIM